MGKSIKKVKFIGMGGFLGAGKTTTLRRLAKHYTDKGLKVGIVTNDQAVNLVDTENLSKDGNYVTEVAGGCFCCKFDVLVDAIMKTRQVADIILAEPVGSCTDVVATVVQPLLDIYHDELEVAPFSVLADPHRIKAILMDQKGSFSEKVAYIYKKQLEEADVIVLNKIDTLDSEARDRIKAFLSKEFSEKTVVAISALTGEGFADWFSFIEINKGTVGRHITEVDYDIYADGEAMLGWLNTAVNVTSSKHFNANNILLDLAHGLRNSFRILKTEPAHLKILMHAGNETGIVNLISNDMPPTVSRSVSNSSDKGQIIINARVEMHPDILQKEVKENLKELCSQYNLKAEIQSLESFKPGRPNPTHRYTKPI